MGSSDGAVAESHGPDDDVLRVDRVQEQPGADDVDDRVGRADFVEMNVVQVDAVLSSLDLTEQAERPAGTDLRSGRKLSVSDELVDLGPVAWPGRLGGPHMHAMARQPATDGRLGPKLERLEIEVIESREGIGRTAGSRQIAGEPADVVQIVTEYSQWLTESNVPKLFVNAEPGGLIAGEVRDFVRSWPQITEVTVPGIHFLQEDSPDLIGQAIESWLATLD